MYGRSRDEIYTAYLILGIQRLRVLTVQEVAKAHSLSSWAWSNLTTVTAIIAWASSLLFTLALIH